jgi:hypothetical protein
MSYMYNRINQFLFYFISLSKINEIIFLFCFQSDILHQSAYELIHSEDRDEFKRHLQWNEKFTNEHQNLTLEQILTNSG